MFIKAVQSRNHAQQSQLNAQENINWIDHLGNKDQIKLTRLLLTLNKNQWNETQQKQFEFLVDKILLK